MNNEKDNDTMRGNLFSLASIPNTDLFINQKPQDISNVFDEAMYF